MGHLIYLFAVSLFFCSQIPSQIQAHNENYEWQTFKYISGSKVIDTWEYLEKVTRKMVEIFEQKHVSGTNLPISDQSINIK